MTRQRQRTDIEIRTSVARAFRTSVFGRTISKSTVLLRHCARGVVNSISKSTSALLPGHLLLEIPVNLYKWRAVQCSYIVTVSFSFSLTVVLGGKKRGDEIKVGEGGILRGKGNGVFGKHFVGDRRTFKMVNCLQCDKSQDTNNFIVILLTFGVSSNINKRLLRVLRHTDTLTNNQR